MYIVNVQCDQCVQCYVHVDVDAHVYVYVHVYGHEHVHGHIKPYHFNKAIVDNFSQNTRFVRDILILIMPIHFLTPMIFSLLSK